MSFIVNGIDIKDLRTHPRIVELRIAAIHTVLARAYGQNEATQFFKSICNVMLVDWVKISGIINSVFTIRRLEKVDRKRYRQEMILMGELWGDKRLYMAKHYLDISHGTLYGTESELSLEDFISIEFVNELINNVSMCGIEPYRIEAVRFLEEYHRFMEVLGRVSIPKNEL